MPLPDDFNAYEFLLEQLRAVHNQQVEASFAGIEANSIGTALESMYTATLITEDDTIDMILLRLFLYHFKFRQDLPEPVYSTPTPDYQSEITFKPQIKFIFREVPNALILENKLRPCVAELSVRLINYTPQTINSSIATEYANKIKEVFGEGLGYTWEKGTHKSCYLDKANGINLAVFAESASVAQGVFERVLEIVNVPFETQFFSSVTREVNFPSVPPMQEIYGKEVRAARKRPTTQVRFERAELHVWGLFSPIVLVDLSRRYVALVV